MANNILKSVSLKNTKQRSSIINIIQSFSEPLTAEEIYKIMIKKNYQINLSTIYRTLNLLTDKNVLLKIIKGDGTASYELNKTTHNHYITCYKCHSSVLIESCPIKELSKLISQETGFKVTGHSLQLTGLCSECSKVK